MNLIVFMVGQFIVTFVVMLLWEYHQNKMEKIREAIREAIDEAEQRKIHLQMLRVGRILGHPTHPIKCPVY